ncbi:MAG TPA: ABC transporter ATP-binding protein, partial [Nitrospiraceae bacterium]|nr:ABC transporter ATP-binding protein [Nitrospiraceae bacterium]
IMVILGASGSGKTMTLKIILGLYRPDSGKVFVDGEEITTMSEEGL